MSRGGKQIDRANGVDLRPFRRLILLAMVAAIIIDVSSVLKCPNEAARSIFASAADGGEAGGANETPMDVINRVASLDKKKQRRQKQRGDMREGRSKERGGLTAEGGEGVGRVGALRQGASKSAVSASDEKDTPVAKIKPNPKAGGRWVAEDGVKRWRSDKSASAIDKKSTDMIDEQLSNNRREKKSGADADVKTVMDSILRSKNKLKKKAEQISASVSSAKAAAAAVGATNAASDSTADKTSGGKGKTGSKADLINSFTAGEMTSGPNLLLAGELVRWREAISKAKAEGISLKGFYHTSAWQPHWKEIVQEQLMLMDGRRPLNFFEGPYPNSQPSAATHPRKAQLLKTGPIYWTPKHWAGVLDYAKLHLTVAGENQADLMKIQKAADELNLKNRDKIEFYFNYTLGRGTFRHFEPEKRAEYQKKTHLSEGESATTLAMHDYCTAQKKAGKKAFVFYLHNKGGCCVRPMQEQYQKAVASWRESMNTFNIEFPSICMRSLLEGYSACGMEYQDAHFSGNFFWANRDHVAALPRLWERYDAWSVEYFPFNVSRHFHVSVMYGENCGYSTHKCRGVNHYDHECHRTTFRDKIVNYIKNPLLPRSVTSTAGPDGPLPLPGEPGGAGKLVSSDRSVEVHKKHHAWVKETCGKLREQRYQQQNYWSKHPERFPVHRKRSSDYERGLDR